MYFKIQQNSITKKNHSFAVSEKNNFQKEKNIKRRNLIAIGVDSRAKFY